MKTFLIGVIVGLLVATILTVKYPQVRWGICQVNKLERLIGR
jgi:hypothetical protein